MTDFSQQTARLLIAARWPLLLLAALIAIVAYFPAQRLQFDRSLENMFDKDDPVVGAYSQLQRIFGGDEIVLAVYTDPNLFSAAGKGIARLDTISALLSQVPGVNQTLSLAEVNSLLNKFQGVKRLLPGVAQATIPLVDPDDQLAAQFLTLFEGYTHGADRQTAAIACLLTPREEAQVGRRETISRLRDVMSSLPGELPAGIITGEPVMVVDGFEYVEADGHLLGWGSTILVSLTIIVCFRSLRWVIVSLAVVRFAMLMTVAILATLGIRLSMVSSMLTAIVTVVGVATIVHVIIRYREGQFAGLDAHASLARAGGILIAPIFWACTTDAIGFAALGVSQIGPVQDFGLMLAIGSISVLVSATLLVPGLALIGSRPRVIRPLWSEKLVAEELTRLVCRVERWPVGIAIATSVVTGLSVIGIGRLEVETDFTKNFRANSPIVRAYDKVERDLGGAGVWDILLAAPETLDSDYIARVDRLQQRLRQLRFPESFELEGRLPLTKVLSLADADRLALNAIDGFVGNPLMQAASRMLLDTPTRVRFMASQMPTLLGTMYGADPENPDEHYLRVMLRSPERLPAEAKQWLIHEVANIASEEFPDQHGRRGAETTGFFVLLAHLIDSLTRDQWTTFIVATAGIGLMMLIALRSFVLALVALVPNALPILIITGALGWIGLPINMGAAMIAAVSMGLSVDSSIHYILAFKRARRDGNSVHESLVLVGSTVGRAVFFSTLALVVGFAVLCVSQFIPTIYFGVLVAFAMLGGLAGNLVILPLLLQAVTRESPADQGSIRA